MGGMGCGIPLPVRGAAVEKIGIRSTGRGLPQTMPPIQYAPTHSRESEHLDARPLTLALSPEYGGEGTGGALAVMSAGLF